MQRWGFTRKSGTWTFYPNSKKVIICSWDLLTKENQFSIEYQWVYQPHFRAGSLSRKSRATKSKLSGNFVDFLFCFDIFIILVLCFDFWTFVYVVRCVCLHLLVSFLLLYSFLPFERERGVGRERENTKVRVSHERNWDKGAWLK